ncbi:Putative vacuolar membrane transporter for cationic amino acids [Rhodotorula sphaerocarpa]
MSPTGSTILLCYTEQSGESLSLLFLFIWLTGDVTNLLGSLWQGLIPTVILVALYYTFCDVVLLFQVFYYRRKRRNHPELYAQPVAAGAEEDDSLGSHPHPHVEPPPVQSEQTPLLSAFSASGPSDAPLSPALQRTKDFVSYAGGFILIIAIGLIAFAAGKKSAKQGRVEEVWDTPAQIVGWISAFLYLGSRLPQLNLNRKTKCAGLSLLMFAFAVCGNATYVASILLTSTSEQHIWINAPWLLGSAGTIFLDFLVLGQFAWYSKERRLEQERKRKIFADDEEQDSLLRNDGDEY